MITLELAVLRALRTIGEDHIDCSHGCGASELEKVDKEDA